ncbi:hypothetical protein N803_14120 [Knoellia subterranea KCTC 19937]|uniref:Uncharacterized protein n=1 Tax=Knoellia subterranea KCTC 19937 TaxID=1385521 RepID=A0A0A0JNB4_9MICO|nr:hypothetical protein N803_14120 [Knoellia subterranea KCTC 19937]
MAPVLGLGLVTLLMAGCAAAANDAVGTGAQSGFWFGLWHGAISPITFIVSLFNDDVAIYEVHNSGHWYDFGFLLGASVAFSGAARTGRPTPRESRKRR